MASAAANADDKKGGGTGSLILFAGLLAALTLVGAGAGAYLGLQFYDSIEKAATNKAAKHADVKIDEQYVSAAHIVALPAIITNLAGDKPAWCRIESSVMFEGDAPPDATLLAVRMAEDMLAYLRTVTLAELASASAFQHLRDDLTERIRIRGGEKVRQLIITSLVLE